MAGRAQSGACVAAMTMLVCLSASWADEVRPPAVSWRAAASAEPGAEPAPIDPATFFQQLVDRYRSLDQYEDTASVEQVTSRDGEETQRSSTQIATVVNGPQLDVQTPMSTLRDELGLSMPGKAMAAIRRQYHIWLAPHMALRFTEQPLRQFRAGVDEGFTATEAEHVEVDRKPMVHLALRSGNGGDSAACQAKFDLFVNPASMLIERIEGEQRLSDGAVMQTTLQITPIRASSDQDDDDATTESPEELVEDSPAPRPASPRDDPAQSAPAPAGSVETPGEAPAETMAPPL